MKETYRYNNVTGEFTPAGVSKPVIMPGGFHFKTVVGAGIFVLAIYALYRLSK